MRLDNLINVGPSKRGSDELLSQTTVSVMAPSAPHADNNNQENAKKLRGEVLVHFLIVGVTEARNRCVGSKLDPKDSLNITLKGDYRDEAPFLRTKAVSTSGPVAEEVFKSSKCFSMSSSESEIVLSSTGDLGEVIRGSGPFGPTLKDEAKALANTPADCL
ncbi:hypothetical protein HHI36_006924 [Cryptolaemus montrouzieri]|uniref:Uncharacterized protein n=1 Tax=Cryptolaemus montrouzieri TaxID=559131 RepID=A0ABD2MN32_9CUCU